MYTTAACGGLSTL